MKKSLIALAALASFAGYASAQSSVTLFGIVDATIAHGSGAVDKTQLTNSGYNSSRLGFRGTEDLGGGMSASFWLEAGLTNDNGTGAATNTNNQASGGGPTATCAVVGASPAVVGVAPTCTTAVSANGSQGLTFNRRSTVSLAGGWGEVRLGRDYNPQFWNLTVFDPFGTNGVGTSQVLNSSINGVIAVRSSNSIGYFLPGNLGGFYGQVQYYMGENAQNGLATEDDGTGLGARFGFANGPFNVALALARTKYAKSATSGDLKTVNIGGQWDFGVAKLMGEYSRDRMEANSTVTGKGGVIGALVPVGAGEIRVAASTYKIDPVGSKTNKLALGYVHNLSKRTAVYTTVARVKNSGGATQALNGATVNANGSSSGFDLGLRHSF